MYDVLAALCSLICDKHSVCSLPQNRTVAVPAITGALLDLLCVRKLNSEAAVLTSGLVPNMWGARGLVELFVMSQMADSLPCKR